MKRKLLRRNKVRLSSEIRIKKTSKKLKYSQYGHTFIKPYLKSIAEREAVLKSMAARERTYQRQVDRLSRYNQRQIKKCNKKRSARGTPFYP